LWLVGCMPVWVRRVLRSRGTRPLPYDAGHYCRVGKRVLSDPNFRNTPRLVPAHKQPRVDFTPAPPYSALPQSDCSARMGSSVAAGKVEHMVDKREHERDV
jgi:hypothetical protein